MFQIVFYESEDGKQPVSDFLDSLDGKMAAKMIGLMEILEEKGTELRLPYSCSVGDGIFELRCKQGTNITRVLYFFFVGRRIIITNGFIKKTQKTPPNEIKTAKYRRDDWIKRHKEADKQDGGD
ncbi:Phage-related protein [Lachnospiraceae bacterium XBB2008]|nr:Phage-related protein [Lachnospiraceae bacterium XBB2008]